MRIAMVGQQGIPAQHGGVERMVEEVGARLVERGHRVTVFNRVPESGERLLEHRGIEIRYVLATHGKYTGNLITSLFSTVAVLRGDFDIIHFHALGPTIWAPLARLKPRLGVVATVHGRDDQRAKWGGAARLMLKVAAKVTATVPHEVTVVSEDLVRDFTAQYGRDTTYVPNGCPVVSPYFAEAPGVLDRYGLEGRPFLLSVGRLVPEKAVDDLLRAYGKTSTEVPLVVVGGSSGSNGFETELRALSRDDPRTVLTGPLYGDELDTVYRRAGGFVTASNLEGLPLTLLEAVTYGLPVLASDIPPHREILGSSGPGHRLFPAGDTSALAGALDEFAASFEADRCGVPCLQQEVNVRYSWDEAARSFEELYGRALRG